MKYPIDLPQILKNTISNITKLNKSFFSPPIIPPDTVLTKLREVCYHASFLTEEKRRLGFRIIFAKQKELLQKLKIPKLNINRTIIFFEAREFTISEILRLSPALDMTQVLICVCQINRSQKNPKLGIWGLLDTGSSWWNFIFHESAHGTPPPNFLTISTSEPGNLSLSAQGQIFISLRNGEIHKPTSGIFETDALSKFFKKPSNLFYKEVLSKLSLKNYDQYDLDEDYPKRFYYFAITRLLFHIRQKNHGGTVFFVPDYLSHEDSRLLDRMEIKYPIIYDNLWNLMLSSVTTHKQYFDLHFRFIKEKNFSKKEYEEISRLLKEMKEIEETMTDCVRFIANLSGVDGAVIITDKFRVLGFGAEVTAHSPSLKTVTIAYSCKKHHPFLPKDTIYSCEREPL